MKTDALAAGRELAPIIVRSRRQTEADRSLAEPIVERLRDTRLCAGWRLCSRSSVATSLKIPTPETLDLFETLAYAEASVAWIVFEQRVYVLLRALYLDTAARATFSDPKWLYASSYLGRQAAAAVDGDGYRIDGRGGSSRDASSRRWVLLL